MRDKTLVRCLGHQVHCWAFLLVATSSIFYLIHIELELATGTRLMHPSLGSAMSLAGSWDSGIASTLHFLREAAGSLSVTFKMVFRFNTLQLST